MKALFVVIGEVFRTGGWQSRIRDRPSAVPDQLRAFKSHVTFMNELKRRHNTKASF